MRLLHISILIVLAALSTLATLWHFTTSRYAGQAQVRGFKTSPRRPTPLRVRPQPRVVNASALTGQLDAKCTPTPDAERKRLLSFLAARAEHCSSALSPVCAAATRALGGATGEQRQLVLTLARWPAQRSLVESFTTAAAALRVRAVVILATSADVANRGAAISAAAEAAEATEAAWRLEAAGVAVVQRAVPSSAILHGTPP